MAKRALITGATGQTGSYLSEILSSEGWEIFGFGSSHKENSLPPKAKLFEVNFLDDEKLYSAVLEINPDVIVNLAAVSSVAQSWEDPVTTFKINASAVSVLLSTLPALELSNRKPTKFVQASSAEIFGANSPAPQNELTPLAPTNPYGASKAAAQHLCSAYRNAGHNVSNAILFNHESPRRPLNFVTRKITSSVAQVSLGLIENFSLGNISIKRDWGWAPDYADAIYKIVISEEASDYVIATGKSHSIRDFLNSAFMSVGITNWADYVDFDEQLIRKTDSLEIRGDASKIKKNLGWETTLTFDQIVSEMVKHDIQMWSEHNF